MQRRLRAPVVVVSLAALAVLARYGSTTIMRIDASAPNAEVGRTLNVATAAAFNGHHTLVAWSDYREHSDSLASDIYAVRLPRGSIVPGEASFRVVAAPNLQSEVTIAAAGDAGWLVAWRDQRDGGGDIYGARVSAAGVTLDDPPIALAITAQDELLPAASFDGTRFWVVHQVTTGPGLSDIRGTAVRLDGTVAIADLSISTAPGAQSEPTIACMTNQCLVAFADNQDGTKDIAATFIQGTTVDPMGLVIASFTGDQDQPAATTHLGNYVVIWQDGRGGTNAIYSGRVTPMGTPLDVNGLALITTTMTRVNPAVDCGGTGFGCYAAWQQNTNGWDIGGSLFNPATGGVVAPAWTGTRFQTFPSVANQGDAGFITAFFDNTFPGNDNVRASMNGPGVSGFISVGTPNQYGSNLIAANDRLYALWLERRVGFFGLRGSINDARGVPTLQFSLTPHAALAVGGTEPVPALAASPTTVLVVWAERTAPSYTAVVSAAVLGSAGPLTDAGVLSNVSFNALGPSADWYGTGFVVVWDDARGGTRDLYAARLSATGAVISAGQAIRTGALDQEHPEIACRGSVCLVVYADQNADGGFTLRSGLLDTVPVSMTLGADQVLDQNVDYEWHDVVASDAGFLAAWTRAVTSNTFAVRTSRVDLNGAPLDGPTGRALSSTLVSAYNPTVASAGDTFDVAWVEAQPGQRSSIEATWVAADGTAAPQTRLVAPGETTYEGPRLAMLGDQAFVSFTDYRLRDVWSWQVLLARLSLDAGQDVDAGTVDAGAVDAGTSDAGLDAGPVDAGGGVGLDAGPPDAGVDAGLDAGTSDAGTSDAGTSDAGTSDAGADADASVDGGTDASTGTGDAGTADAGATDRVGPGALETGSYGVGCGCSSTGGAGPLVLLLLAGFRRWKVRRER